MAFVHGKSTIVKVNAIDLSTFTNNTAFNLAADSHDTTTYGQTGHTFAGGLTNGTITLTGTYDGAASATPRVVIKPLLGSTTAFIFQGEGNTTGKPQDACTVLVTAYEQTNPVAGMIAWTAKFQITGAVTSTTLP